MSDVKPNEEKEDGGLRLPSDINMHPIAVVQNEVDEPRPDGWASCNSEIVVMPQFHDDLLGLDSYSHLIVIFWLHLIPKEMMGQGMQVSPGQDKKITQQGVMATRSQLRPLPIGVSVVPILNIRNGIK